MSEHQFRNTMFGGFNRQDVLDFLTSSAEKNNQEMQRQRESYEALEKDLAAGREESAILRAELSEARQERDEFKSRVEQLELDLAKVRGSEDRKTEEASALREKLTLAQQELEELRELVTRLTPDAEAYTAIKDRTAGVELEAHRRAQSVEARAKIMAGDLQRQMEQWAMKAEEQYTALRGQIDSSVEQANQELLAASRSLACVAQMMEQQQESLRTVVESYAQSIRGKKAE